MCICTETESVDGGHEGELSLHYSQSTTDESLNPQTPPVVSLIRSAAGTCRIRPDSMGDTYSDVAHPRTEYNPNNAVTIKNATGECYMNGPHTTIWDAKTSTALVGLVVLAGLPTLNCIVVGG